MKRNIHYRACDAVADMNSAADILDEIRHGLSAEDGAIESKLWTVCRLLRLSAEQLDEATDSAEVRKGDIVEPAISENSTKQNKRK